MRPLPTCRGLILIQMSGNAHRPEKTEPSLTVLLNRMGKGDKEAGEQAIARVYDELHRIAHQRIRHERPGHILQTTALIHEAYMRLISGASLEFNDREHFYAIASRQMRRVLVDYALARNAEKRGGNIPHADVDQVQVAVAGEGIDVLALDHSLEKLEQIDIRAAQVVELKFFGGYTDKEVVDVVKTSLASVRRDWE